jgi:hypothetical protein
VHPHDLGRQVELELQDADHALGGQQQADARQADAQLSVGLAAARQPPRGDGEARRAPRRARRGG